MLTGRRLAAGWSAPDPGGPLRRWSIDDADGRLGTIGGEVDGEVDDVHDRALPAVAWSVPAVAYWVDELVVGGPTGGAGGQPAGAGGQAAGAGGWRAPDAESRVP